MATCTGTGTGTISGTVAITDGNGYLLRKRPPERWFDWSKVPVGRAAALQLSHRLSTRDLEIMRFAERFGMVTLEQIGRVFFNSENPTSRAVMNLRKRRYLARIDVHPPYIAEAVGRRPDVTNAVYVLDWNGFYYLRYHAGGASLDTERSKERSRESGGSREAADGASGRERDLSGGENEKEAIAVSRWNPATAAQVNSRFGHTLSLSEIWSYIMAAARATHERPTPQHPGDQIKYRLKAFILNEREAWIPSDLAVLTRHTKGREGLVDSNEAGRLLALPDAAIALSFQVSLSSLLSTQPLPPSLPSIPHPPPPPPPLARPATGLLAASHPTGKTEKRANQYDPSLRSWQLAFLPVVPFPARGQVSEPSSPFTPRYRFVFVEMETGSNNRDDLRVKIERYNRVHRRQDIWQYMYGERFPRVLVVVRSKDQLERTALMWQTGFAYRAQTAVLITSLQLLADAYSYGRQGLIELPCWLDVFGTGHGTGHGAGCGFVWRTLDDALGIDLVVAEAETAFSAGTNAPPLFSPHQSAR